MKNSNVNLRDLVILIADPNAYARRITNGILRGFGANKVLEVEQSLGLFQVLTGQKIDILLCDTRLPPHGGLMLTRSIRRNSHNENRTIPILLMSSDTSESTIKNARDAGANMVVAKPMSPKSLYDRLGWIAFNPRPFIDTETYFGPDRRFKIEGYPGGVGRRKGDKQIEVAEEAGPVLAQDDIDSLFSAARKGQPDG
jgi:CheY-like chemotaxis protein